MLFDMSLKLTLLYKRFYLFRKFIGFFDNFLHCKTEYNFLFQSIQEKVLVLLLTEKTKQK